MPELPEVETVRRGLSPVMEGRVIEHAAINRPNLRFAFPDRFRERLEGQTVTALDRRAKYLLAHLPGGETLLMHLGMSGRFTIVDEAGESGANTPGAYSHPAGDQSKHDHVIFRMSGGVFLIFNDARRFGFMTLFASAGGTRPRPFSRGWDRNRSGTHSRPRISIAPSRESAPRSSRPCSTSGSSRVWGISMSAKRCGGPGYPPKGWRARYRARVRRGWCR